MKKPRFGATLGSMLLGAALVLAPVCAYADDDPAASEDAVALANPSDGNEGDRGEDADAADVVNPQAGALDVIEGDSFTTSTTVADVADDASQGQDEPSTTDDAGQQTADGESNLETPQVGEGASGDDSEADDGSEADGDSEGLDVANTPADADGESATELPADEPVADAVAPAEVATGEASEAPVPQAVEQAPAQDESSEETVAAAATAAPAKASAAPAVAAAPAKTDSASTVAAAPATANKGVTSAPASKGTSATTATKSAKGTSATTASKPTKATTTEKLPSYFGVELVGKKALSNGLYEIVSGRSSLYAMRIKGQSKQIGAFLEVYVRNNTIGERWRFRYNKTTKTYTITNVNSGKLLEVRDGMPSQKGDVQQDRANGDAAQQWRLFEAADGRVYMVSARKMTNGSFAVLTIYNGAPANGKRVLTYQHYKTAGSLAQQWELAPIKRTVADGVYQMRSGVSKKYTYLLDTKGSARANGTNVQIYSAKNDPSQWWNVKYDAKTGYYKVCNLNSGKALQVAGNKRTNGTNIEINRVKSTSAQRWSILPDLKGGYQLVSGNGSRAALSVKGNAARRNTNVDLRTSGDNTGQNWTFVKINTPAIKTGTYQITPMSNVSGTTMGVASASKNNAANVILGRRGTANNLKWNVGAPDGKGWRQITAAHSGAYLSVNAKGNVVMSNSAKTTNHQLWKIVATEKGYQLINKAVPTKAVSLSGEKAVAKANVNTATNKNQNSTYFAFVPDKVTVNLKSGTPIMGDTPTTQIQAVRYYKSLGFKLPSKWVKDGETIEKLVKYFWEEGAAEGVRADVAFAQSLHETGNFQFGNLVQPAQYNFAGLGATGPGHPGHTYKSARLGIRAQIQHLKAYASTAPLNQELIDERFDLVQRGCAPTIDGLSGRWAVPGYDYDGSTKVYYHDYIMSTMRRMLTI